MVSELRFYDAGLGARVGRAIVMHPHNGRGTAPVGPASARWQQNPWTASGAGAPPQPGAHRRRPAGSVWPAVANQLFFASHDSFGDPEVHADVVGLGLGAALLAELMLAERLTSEYGMLVVVETTAPADDLANTVLARVRAEHSLSVNTWIAALALDAVADVGDRLSAAGRIRVQRPRRLRTLGLTRATRFVPVDVNEAAVPAARIADTIRRGEYLHVVDAVLAGLMVAMGLHREVLDTWDPGIEQHIRNQLARLVPADVQDLISRTEAAVGAGVLIR
jgi:hypothetical protein